ncbi:vacuole protein [Schizopora paradoxa]|uniref:Vacuole protein n=1 Tax=Schizopora paradoxa TaxID=27342 RepID=A0A0H2S792_9AGAM|nr:vacuole protein [Schizopora paradoxa]
MCCGGPQWKREIVPDHKFDFIDTRDFTDHGCVMRMKYLWIYVLVLKSFLVYVFDIYTAITMLTTSNWSNHIFNSCKQTTTSGCITIPFSIGKWLFVGCIIFSFLLLAYEARKARKIIQSRDISYAFTNIMANNYYSLRSYDHFCFFSRINNSTKKTDDFAFFVFFTFKSWKRLLLADGPRQVINGLTLYSFYLSQKDNPGSFWDLNKYTNGSLVTAGLIFSTVFTLLIFLGSALLLLAAGICYIPLLCYIRGNLKEYCCHKVDKRISEIVKRKNKERLAKYQKDARKEAAGDFSHLKNKKGEIVKGLPQPTLPNVQLDDDDFDDSKSRIPPSTYAASDYYYNSDNKSAYSNDYPPPMPGYNNQQHYHQAYTPSAMTSEDQGAYYSEYSSQVSLTAAAAPMARLGVHDRSSGQSGPLANPHSANYQTETFGTDAQPGYAVSTDANAYGYEGDAYGAYEQDIGQAYTGYDSRHHEYANSNAALAPPPSRTPHAQYDQYDQGAYAYEPQHHGGSDHGTGYGGYGRGAGGGGYAG